MLLSVQVPARSRPCPFPSRPIQRRRTPHVKPDVSPIERRRSLSRCLSLRSPALSNCDTAFRVAGTLIAWTWGVFSSGGADGHVEAGNRNQEPGRGGGEAPSWDSAHEEYKTTRKATSQEPAALGTYASTTRTTTAQQRLCNVDKEEPPPPLEMKASMSRALRLAGPKTAWRQSTNGGRSGYGSHHGRELSTRVARAVCVSSEGQAPQGDQSLE